MFFVSAELRKHAEKKMNDMERTHVAAALGPAWRGRTRSVAFNIMGVGA